MKFYVLITSITLSVLAATYLIGGQEYMKASYYASGLSFVNAVAAYTLAVRGVKMEYGNFMKSVFGGMAIRLFVMIILAVFLIKFEVVPTISFFLLLVLYYIIHQIIEIGILGVKNVERIAYSYNLNFVRSNSAIFTFECQESLLLPLLILKNDQCVSCPAILQSSRTPVV